MCPRPRLEKQLTALLIPHSWIRHLSQLLLVTLEGPCSHPSREQLVDVVYVWYRKNQRRIQLPDPVAVNAGLRCTSGPTM